MPSNFPILERVIKQIGTTRAAEMLDLNNRETLYGWLKRGLPWRRMDVIVSDIVSIVYPDNLSDRIKLSAELIEESSTNKLDMR